VLISCEQCSIVYSLDDHLVAPGGVPVQCTGCGHIFMAMPPVFEEQAWNNPPVPDAPPSFYGEEEKAPSLGVTQIFGVSPSDEMLLASALSTPPLAEKNFEYGHAASNTQTARGGLTGILESEPNEVAYFDFGANASQGGPPGSHPPYASPAAKPSAPPAAPKVTPPVPQAAASPSFQAMSSSVSQRATSSASHRIAVSFRNAPPLPPSVQQEAQAASSAASGLFEQTVEPKPESVDAELPADVAKEIRRVEDEQAAQLQRFHQSAEFLTQGRKTRHTLTLLGVFFLILLAAVVGIWRVLH